MRKLSLLPAFILALTLAPACGGGGDPGDDDDDDDIVLPDADPTTPDAAPGAPDAPPAGGVTLGGTCNGTMGQADCEAGLECLSLTGGSAPWCSEECTQGQACGAGYAGPGMTACIYGVDFGGGNVRYFCGVVCEDLAGGSICPTCDGTCPGDLQCVADLSDSGGTVVAKGCQ